MEHKRAIFLINKSGLEEADKKFLLTHLEMAEAIIKSLKTEILVKKDIIDYNNAINNKILTIKEYICTLEKDTDTKVLEKKLDKILEELNKQ